MPRNPSILALPIILALALAACAPPVTPAPTAIPPTTVSQPTPVPTVEPAPTTAPITLADSLGREVTLAAPAERIVTLAPSNTEILFALGAGDRLIGRDEFSTFPEAANDVPSIGSMYPSVNAEAIVALQPDLVLAAGITSPDDVKKLADLGLTVYATKIDADFDDVYDDIRAVGQLTGLSDKADALVAEMKSRVEAVTAKTSTAAQRPVVFYEIDGTDPAKPWTAGPGSFVDQLITMAGGVNTGSVGTDQYLQLSLEQLVAQDPDIILLGSYAGQTPEMVSQRVGWETLKAVMSGAVYVFDDDLATRPGPRLVDGLEMLAKLIHPELFQ